MLDVGLTCYQLIPSCDRAHTADIRQIIGDDEALMPLILPFIRAYNLSQLTAVEHPEADGVPAHYVSIPHSRADQICLQHKLTRCSPFCRKARLCQGRNLRDTWTPRGGEASCLTMRLAWVASLPSPQSSLSFRLHQTIVLTSYQRRRRFSGMPRPARSSD